jgi:hypothetical protein
MRPQGSPHSASTCDEYRPQKRNRLVPLNINPFVATILREPFGFDAAAKDSRRAVIAI